MFVDRWDFVYWFRRPVGSTADVVEAVASDGDKWYVVTMGGRINERGEYEIMGEPIPIDGPKDDPVDMLCSHLEFYREIGIVGKWDKQVEKFCSDTGVDDEIVFMKHLRIRRSR